MGFVLCGNKLIHGDSLHCLDAFRADILSAERNDVLGTVTEDAGGLIFFHDDAGAIDVDLQAVSFCNIQRAAQFDGQDNAPQLVDLTHDTGRFNTCFIPFQLSAYDQT